MFEKVRNFVSCKSAEAKTACSLAVVTASTLAFPLMSYAETQGSSADISQTLATSFQSMADTMIQTIMATLPVVMSVMSAYLCINFGIKFFKRFAKPN